MVPIAAGQPWLLVTLVSVLGAAALVKCLQWLIEYGAERHIRSVLGAIADAPVEVHTAPRYVTERDALDD